MAPIRKLADVVIDTTGFNVHELRQFIVRRFQSRTKRPLMVSLVSFGYRYGVPADADLVFDVRFLPNPHFIPRIRQIFGTESRRWRGTSVLSRRPASFCGASRAADLSDSALHSRGQELSDHRLRLHRRAAPFGDDGRGDAQGAGRARLHGQGRAPRPGQMGALISTTLSIHCGMAASAPSRACDVAGTGCASVEAARPFRVSAAAALRAALSRCVWRLASRVGAGRFGRGLDRA